MKHSIPYYIREQLREDRTVYIPGLGSFNLVHTPASISEGRTLIYPPSLSLEFSEATGDETPLVKRISYVEGLTVEKAKKKLAKYTSSIFNKLININTVDIDGIGTLTRSDDEVIGFNDSVVTLTDQYNGLKTLSLVPAKRLRPDAVSTTVAATTTVTTTTVPTADSVEASSLSDTTTTVKDKLVASAAQTTAATTATITPPKSKAPERVRLWPSILMGVMLGAAIIFGLRECKDGGLLDMKKSAPIGLEEESTQETSQEAEVVFSEEGDTLSRDDQIIVTKAETAKVKAVVQSVNYDGATCTIIVGSYANQNNAGRMINRISKMGYEVYTSQYQGMTRVGVEFPCHSKELDGQMEFIKNKFGSSAWLLEDN